MINKKKESDEPADKPKRKSKKVIDSSNPKKPKRKKSTTKNVEKLTEDNVKTPPLVKVEWRDSINPFKLSDYYTDDPDEINLISLLELLSETEDECCDFEFDENLSQAYDDPVYDAWIQDIETRFDAVVGPFLEEKQDI